MTSLRFPHRSITHSLLATAGITAISLGVNYFFLHGSIKAAIALPLGHLLACFSDTFTKQGDNNREARFDVRCLRNGGSS